MKDDLRKLCVVWFFYIKVVMNYMRKYFVILLILWVGIYFEGFYLVVIRLKYIVNKFYLWFFLDKMVCND